jgi:hypothetical protein
VRHKAGVRADKCEYKPISRYLTAASRSDLRLDGELDRVSNRCAEDGEKAFALKPVGAGPSR